MNKHLISLVGLSLFAGGLHAAVVWTGSANTDIFNDANWDFSGAVNSTTSVDPGVAINEDLAVASGTLTGTGGNLVLGDGHSLTLTASTLVLTGGTTGISGVDDGLGAGRINAPATVNLINSTARMQFTTVGTDFVVDGTSILEFYGAGDPINSQTELTRILLVTGSTLTLASSAEFTEQGAEIFVNGTVYDPDGNGATPSNDALWNNTGATRVAVPEVYPVAAMGALGLLTLLRRRR